MSDHGPPYTFVDDPSSSHYRSQLVVIGLGGEKYAIPKNEAIEFYRHLGTAIGCLRGVDAKVYTEINEMVRNERGRP